MASRDGSPFLRLRSGPAAPVDPSVAQSPARLRRPPRAAKSPGGPVLPGDRAIRIRERAGRAVGAEKRKTHRLACALFDGDGSLMVVEIGCGESGIGGIDLDALGFQAEGEAERDCVDRYLRGS